MIDPDATGEAAIARRAESSERAEEVRLRALHGSGVLDTSVEREYDDITELAAFICGTPISLISFVDKERQWFKSKRGISVPETPRSQSFCAHTLEGTETLVVRDASLDLRFQTNPLVVGDPKIRFYAGAPIVEKGGQVLGTVCVIDTKPRELSTAQISALEALARQVVVLLDQRTAIQGLEEAAQSARVSDLAIRDSERRLESFVNSLPALAWTASADGFITWYNRRWYEYTGTTPQQMEGWGWQAVHDPRVLPSVMERWTASIRTGDPFEMVFPLRGADGVFRPFLTRIEPLRSDEGQIVQWFGTNIEVDALQKTQLALERNETLLKQVLTATTDAVVSVDREWMVRYLNPRAEFLFGEARHLIGRNVWEAFPDWCYAGSPFVEHYQRAMSEGVAGNFEADYGSPVPFTVGMEVYPSEDGIVTFSRDVTKMKHATAAVLQNEKLAAVGRLASTIAHEINNPLEAVTNLVYLSRHSRDLEEAEPYLATADLELRRAAAIVSRTLRFHRQATKPTSVHLSEFLDGLFVGQHSRLLNSGTTVLQQDRSTLPVVCLEGEIRQVLVNLVSNAIDSMHGSAGTMQVRGRDGRSWRTGEAGLVITIADSGAGMSEATKARVFEAFYSTKGIGGTGLGLWISKEIVDRHRGSLRFRSSRTEGASGTVFRLFLPHGSGAAHPPSVMEAVL